MHGLALAAVLLAAPSPAEPLLADLRALYEDLHRTPELSFRETETAGKLAGRLRALGFEVTTGVGRTGVVGVLRNGPGPTVLLRTDMDALPVQEKTGLPYASARPGVMHACGHDLHMTVWIGAAAALARSRGEWTGTLVLVGQPAEEVGQGAAAMLDDGLLTRFPRPDAALALHDMHDLPAGTVGWRAGPVMPSADSVDVVFHGRGGHGALPHLTVDPIVLAARFVLGVQTLVSRETSPLEPAVVTVGSVHGGTKHNIIPDEVRLQMTVRAFGPAVRDALLAGIERQARAEAQAAGAPRPPEIAVARVAIPTVNDPALVERLVPAIRTALGEARVVPGAQVMAAEDFSLLAAEGIPSALFWLGATPPAALEEARRSGTPVPGLHAPEFAPGADAAIRTGVEALVAAARELLSTPPGPPGAPSGPAAGAARPPRGARRTTR